jgi:hypothetical protein
MAGLRGLVVGLVLGSAVVSVPARAQLGASVSLTHTVSVTVPPRVKVQVASLAFSAPVPARVSSSQTNVDGLSLTINATQAWVLAVGSSSNASAPKSHLQWSTDVNSGYSTMTTAGASVASGVTAYKPKAANLFFRNGVSAAAQGGADAEPIVLTITAP